VCYDIGQPVNGLVTQAVVAFADRQDVTWPFVDLNKTLEHFYNGAGNETAIPQLYSAREAGSVVGYLAMPRNTYSQTEINEIFWGAAEAAELVTSSGNRYDFLGDPPFVGNAVMDGGVIGVMGYQLPSWIDLPLDKLNTALRMLLGQLEWPTTLAPFIYPVAKGGSPLLAGIWIAPPVDNLNRRTSADDEAFHRIRQLYFPNEAPLSQRVQAHARLHAALSAFPDFKKE